MRIISENTNIIKLEKTLFNSTNKISKQFQANAVKIYIAISIVHIFNKIT